MLALDIIVHESKCNPGKLPTSKHFLKKKKVLPLYYNTNLLSASLLPVLWSLISKVICCFYDNWYIQLTYKTASFIKHDTSWVGTQACKRYHLMHFSWHFWKHTLQILKYTVRWVKLMSNARERQKKNSVFENK